MGQAQAIFERLESDHNEHRELLDKIEHTSGASSERSDLFEKLTKDIKSHAAAEEQALYATMLRKPPTLMKPATLLLSTMSWMRC